MDNWQEIFYTIKENKLRTFLTGFSVAWGIFMLVLLLGSGSGLRNGVSFQFSGDAVNFVMFWGGQVSKAYKGTSPGTKVDVENKDFSDMTTQTEGLSYSSPHKHLWYGAAAKYGRNTIQNDLVGINPEYLWIKNLKVLSGRWINDIDISVGRRVGVIKKKSADLLFGEENPIGKDVDVKGLHFKIVGVYDTEGRGRQRGNDYLYVPMPLIQRASANKKDLGSIQITFDQWDVEKNMDKVNQMRDILAKNHEYDITDPRATRSRTTFDEYEKFMNLFSGINIFLWVVGVMTLIAGVVGVSNIMLIVAKERTKEIGLRKAIGATSGSIIRLFLQESILITFVSGYTGLIAGLGIMELVSLGMEKAGGGSDFFRSPEVDFMTALGALALIVVAGALAGYFPARVAASTTPIEALRDE